MRRVSTTHPCVFKDPFVREQIDPRIKVIWPDAPYGNLRRLWREMACAETNPYGSETCPYPPEDCALAFFQAVEKTVYAMPRKSRTGYFRSVARTAGMERAERKPLAREQEGPGNVRGRGSGLQTRPDEVRSTRHRPVRIGELLGPFTARSHQGPPTNGSESEK